MQIFFVERKVYVNNDFHASTNIVKDYVISKADDLYLPLPIVDYADT